MIAGRCRPESLDLFQNQPDKLPPNDDDLLLVPPNTLAPKVRHVKNCEEGRVNEIINYPAF